MFTPDTLQQWLGEQTMPLLILVTVLVVGFAIVYLSAQSHRKSQLRNRSNRSEQTFVDDLTPFGYDAGIASATYRYLQARQNVAFPIVPLDDLDLGLGLDSEDLSQTIRELLEETGRTHLPGLLYSPLVTVEDLVRYIQASPRRAELAA